MSETFAIPQVKQVQVKQAQPNLQFLRSIPGILLLAAIGYAGKLLEQNVGKYAKSHHWIFPNIEYVLWAILLGLAISNTVGVPAIFRAGVATYEFWLKVGIVLLGARFLLGDVLKLGGVSLALVAIEITGAIAFMTLLGRIFHLKPKLTTLLAVGSAVCGVSAIIATQGRHRSRRRRFLVRHRRHPRSRRALALHFPADRPRAPSQRSCLRPLGRPRRR